MQPRLGFNPIVSTSYVSDVLNSEPVGYTCCSLLQTPYFELGWEMLSHIPRIFGTLGCNALYSRRGCAVT